MPIPEAIVISARPITALEAFMLAPLALAAFLTFTPLAGLMSAVPSAVVVVVEPVLIASAAIIVTITGSGGWDQRKAQRRNQ